MSAAFNKPGFVSYPFSLSADNNVAKAPAVVGDANEVPSM